MKYEIGQIVKGKITGIQAYGAFIALDPHTSGLIHISEISDGYVKDISQFVQIGDNVEVKIIDFDQKSNQARCSLKALHRTHRRRGHYTHNRKASLPNSTIGFTSIAQALPQWIEEAKKENKL